MLYMGNRLEQILGSGLPECRVRNNLNTFSGSDIMYLYIQRRQVWRDSVYAGLRRIITVRLFH